MTRSWVASQRICEALLILSLLGAVFDVCSAVPATSLQLGVYEAGKRLDASWRTSDSLLRLFILGDEAPYLTVSSLAWMHLSWDAGVTLRENNLKEIEGGTIMESQGALVASKKALLNRPGLLEVGGGEK